MRTRLPLFAFLLSVMVAGVLSAGDDRMSYIYKHGGSSSMRIGGSWSNLGAVTKKYGDEFVWVRLSGRSYVIRDAATLAEVREAFREVTAMEPSMREVERRLKPYEQQMETAEEHVDALGDRLDDESLSDSARESIEAKLRDAERDLAAIEKQMSGIEREMETLEKEEERREAIAEDRFEGIVERAIRRGVAERAP
jgi:chromosome segregation ATPase